MSGLYAIGIGGGTGSGKTTMAKEVARSVNGDVSIIPLDNYYRDQSDVPPEERRETNYDHPDAFEWELVRSHLEELERGEPIDMPQYDFEIHNRTGETEGVEPNGVVVVEGILALYDPELRDLYDLNLYVQTDADVRILRRVKRDLEDRGREFQGVMDQYLSTVKPMHERFVEPTKSHADVVILEGVNESAVDLLKHRLDAELDV